MRKYIILTLVLSLVGAKAWAEEDFTVENADGVTIYYNIINDGTEVEVRRGVYNGHNPINLVIPEEVTYQDKR